MKCEYCEKEHEGTYGSGRFCSDKCAKGFSTKNKRSLISETLKRIIKEKHPLIPKKCEKCGKEFFVKKKKINQKTCSKKCSAQLRASSEIGKKQLSKLFSDSAKKRYKNGDTTIGWQSRNKMSRPEKITKDILERNGLSFDQEFKIGKYFIDFALPNKIALEIDGKQHNYKERKEKDLEKDKFLIEQGWKIIRISWDDKQNMEEKILEKI